MPDNMRLHARTECPVEDTPPSTRPSSAASSSPSTSSTPHRSTSMDSLHTNSSTSDKPSGEELIPTRVVRAAPKSNSNALQFIKTGPANLHRSAREQMKKADIVKSLRKSSLQEEEEWQSNSNPKTPEDNSDWQENLDKWKSSRRKRNEDVLERVIEVKKYEQEEEYSKGRRKSKTFNEMREDTNRKGRRYNLVVHDDDNNDLSDLGLSSGGKLGSSLSDAAEDSEHKDMDNDNKDTKSDAGFCTGSDTGSDGVFPEDISDTSSALDDKKDAHDSLLDTTSSTTGLSNEAKDSMEPHGLNGHDTYASSSSTSKISSVASQSSEYTYDKAIEDYKQFAVNSVKKRSSSVTSLSSNASFSKEDEKVPHRSQGLSKKMDEKLSYFHRERDVPHKKEVYEPKIVRREKNLKVDINKRRSMFELRDIDNKVEKQKNRRSFDVGSKLKTKVLSFENIPDSDSRPRAITPQRDTKFKEKLASFSHFTKPNSSTTPVRKKTPERDENFYKKLQSFTRMESQINSKSVERNSDKFCKSSTERTQPDTHAARKLETRKTPDLKPTNSRNTEQSVSPLKDRICSFENLIPSEDSFRTREKSVSMECLAKNSLSEELKPIHASQSVTNIYRRTMSTPYMVVEVDEPVELEQTFVKENISRKCQMTSSKQEAASKIKYGSTESLEIKLNNNLSVFERPTELSRDLPPQVPPPKVPSSPTTDNSLSSRAKTRVSSSPLRLTSSAKTTSESTSSPPRVSASPTRRSPSPAERRIASSPIRNRASPSPVRVSLSSSPSRKPLSPPVTPPCTTEELQYSLVRDTSRKYSDVQNCSAEFELRNTEDYEDENEDDSCHLQEYGDDDIDEVIDNYERLSESVTGGVASAENEHVYEAASEMTTLMRTPMMRESCEDNVYEHIQDDDPVYENIYDKIQEPIEDEDEKSLEGDFCNHHYQTLDEVQTKVEKLPLPALPPKNSTLSSIEVLDVTWTDESASRALLPPSVPPPPPPTDDDDVEDGPEAERQLRLSSFSASSGIAKEDRKTKSNTSTKKEIRQKMSDFLGTQPHTEEEVELQPPPDVNEILRQQREAERLIVQKQQSLPRESPLLEFDTLVPQPYRSKYTWEDRMRDDSARPHDSDESGDHFEFHTSRFKKGDTNAVRTYLKYINSHSLDTLFYKNLHSSQSSENLNSNHTTPDSLKNSKVAPLSLSNHILEAGVLNLKSLIKASPENFSDPKAGRSSPVERVNDFTSLSRFSSFENSFSSFLLNDPDSVVYHSNPDIYCATTDFLETGMSSAKQQHMQNNSPVQQEFFPTKLKTHKVKQKNELSAKMSQLTPKTQYQSNTEEILNVVHDNYNPVYKIRQEEEAVQMPEEPIQQKQQIAHLEQQLVEKNQSYTQETLQSLLKNLHIHETHVLAAQMQKNKQSVVKLQANQIFMKQQEPMKDNQHLLRGSQQLMQNNQSPALAVLQPMQEQHNSLPTIWQSLQKNKQPLLIYQELVKKNDKLVQEICKLKGKNNLPKDQNSEPQMKTHEQKMNNDLLVQLNLAPTCPQQKHDTISPSHIIGQKESLLYPYAVTASHNLSSLFGSSKPTVNQEKRIMKADKCKKECYDGNERTKNSSKILTTNQCASIDILPDVKISRVHDKNTDCPISQQATNGDGPSSSRTITIIFPANSISSNFNSTYVIASTPTGFRTHTTNVNADSDSSTTPIPCNHPKSSSSFVVPSDFVTQSIAVMTATTSHTRSLNAADTVITSSVTQSESVNCLTRSHTTVSPTVSPLSSESAACSSAGNQPHTVTNFEKPVTHFQHDVVIEEESYPKSLKDDSASKSVQYAEDSSIYYGKKLAELELEMVKHDREILQRIKATEAAGDRMKELAVSDHIVPDSRVNLPTVADARIKGQTAAESRLQSLSQLEQTSRISNEETLFSSSSSCIPPPLQYEYVQSGQQIYHDKCLEETSSSVSPHSFNNHSGDSVVKLPLQEFYTAPTYNERSSHVLNTASCHENAFYEESKSIQSGHKLRSELNATTEPGPRKQSILALSAIPKPRLVDNDSWIMKKKTDVGKKDYNKHWLFHEAEQRRLEQQDCITRSRPPVTDPTAKFPSPMPSAPSYHSHFQNMKSNFSQSDNINYSQHISNGPSAYPNMSNVSPSPYCNHNSPTNIAKPPRSNLTNTTPVSNISSSHSSSSQSLSSNGSLSSTSNNNWKKQTKTYQPETLQQANSSKPLPDAIINTLTQRVNNKNKNNGSSKPSVYSTAYRDESYHDYMNTDFSTPSPNISPTLHQGTIPQQQQQQQEEQRLLSVSGKKKCSHCGEELGRGAAMIIESLRLFYHIPCFKCCVCGIQLGNGTSGADVRVRNHKLHCHNCYSNDEGMKFSKV